MADSKETILAKMQQVRSQAQKLAVCTFALTNTTLTFALPGGVSPLMEVADEAAGIQLVSALNAALAAYKAAIKFDVIESALADEYKTAKGAEVAVVEE